MTSQTQFDNLRPKILVIGIGGAGGNAVNRMIQSNLEGAEFIAANTDAQALKDNLASRKIQLGFELTQGLGAGSKPDIGSAAAEETLTEIENLLKGAHMLFITAGMGGGTGTGAAPIIARAAREAGILTVGVVTKPFLFEGSHRMKTAESGLKELQKHVDTLIVIPNQNLFRLADAKTTFSEAFNMADNVLYSGVRGVTDLMIMPGLINLDFADVRTVMSEMGKAMMGTGESEGENRAIAAAEAAIANPLLDEVSLRGARGVLINITGGMDMTLFEVDEAANHIREQVDKNANIIFGSTFDDRMQGKIRVSVVATGIEKCDAPTAVKSPFHVETTSESTAQKQLDFQNVPLEKTIDFSAEEDITLNLVERMEDSLENSLVDRGLEDMSAPVTATPESPKKALSFLEKLGFKKTPEESVKIQKIPAPVTDALSQESLTLRPTSSETETEEDMDIPTFLRKKR
jgi:cell division protein FtsZ